MNKKIISKLLISSAVLFGVALTSANVSADNTPLFKAGTSANVGFNIDQGETKPKDPNNPTTDNPNDNGNVTPTHDKGELTLDAIPSSFDFGVNNNIEAGKEQNVQSRLTGKQFLQVTDKRGASQQGWAISVKQIDGFISDKKDKLEGATITIPNQKVTSTNGDSNNNYIDDKFNANSNISINKTDQEIFSTKDGYKKGTAIDSWDASGVNLKVPEGEAESGAYTATIQWSLTTGA